MDQEERKVDKKRPRRVVLGTVLAVSSAIMLGIFSRIENWKRDFSVNHAELNPQSSDPLLRPYFVDRSPGDYAQRVQQWAESQARWTLESRESHGDNVHLHLTRTTLLLRFTDDIEVQLSGENGGTKVAATSQSRFGKGDLGQNPRNLRELVRGLREDL